MPNNISHQDVGSEIRALHARLSRIENSPQVGHQSILDGSLNILDSSGRVLMVLGNQPDGTVGVASYNPDTGVKQAQMGQQAGGLYGLSVLNTASNKVQLVAGTAAVSVAAPQFTASTTPVAFADDQVVSVTVGASGQALVMFGCNMGTGGDGDQGTMALSIDGVVSTQYLVRVSCGGVGVGVQASASETILITGLAAGSHTFTPAYYCATGVHGITVARRYVSVSPF